MIEPYDIARRLGLDGHGGLYRPDHGVSDARSAHPAFDQGRFDRRGTSARDVQAVSRYLSLQGLGTTGPRPGVRSRRRRSHAKAEVGDQEITTMLRLYDVASSHREAAIFVYQQHGRLYPKMWVESETMIALIEPSSWEVCMPTDWQRAQMLSMVTRSLPGFIMGRTDEVYIRDLDTPGARRNPKDNLAELVDFDPSIRTALMIHAVDLRNTETYLTMATFDLDNEGLPFWERHENIRYFEQFAIPLWAAAKVPARRDRKTELSQYEADEFCEKHGWVVTRLDK